ncbi:MAG: cytochrome c [Pseudolabrys sp.]
MTRRRRRVLPTAVLLGGTVLGISGTFAAAAADFELGRYLSTECVTCHRSASAQGAIPSIYGIPESAFVEVMKAYKEKKLSNQVMQNITARLSDEDIAALALYFAKTEKPN